MRSSVSVQHGLRCLNRKLSVNATRNLLLERLYPTLPPDRQHKKRAAGQPRLHRRTSQLRPPSRWHRKQAWATSIARQFLARCSLDTPLCERFLAASEVEPPGLPSREHQCEQASAKNNVPSQHTCNRTRKEGALQAFHHRVALGAAFRSKCQQRASISEQPNECL